jgi:hypothetical protein
MHAAAPELEIPAVEFKPAEVSAWALDALSEARKATEDTYATLGEFARPVATGPALIWADVEVLRLFGRLAVTA